ncbi:unnamed protein product [Paramecium primaurelia]|uniref:Uncharacterized protein n=1 Tax=Paramecium primaurelia TaxID=5886 RepID=A0A8S1KPG7_PARPR|nr:unnamed protein product [Paramecium primaurelia]
MNVPFSHFLALHLEPPASPSQTPSDPIYPTQNIMVLLLPKHTLFLLLYILFNRLYNHHQSLMLLEHQRIPWPYNLQYQQLIHNFHQIQQKINMQHHLLYKQHMQVLVYQHNLNLLSHNQLTKLNIFHQYLSQHLPLNMHNLYKLLNLYPIYIQVFLKHQELIRIIIMYILCILQLEYKYFHHQHINRILPSNLLLLFQHMLDILQNVYISYQHKHNQMFQDSLFLVCQQVHNKV